MTTRAEISTWFERGVHEGATHMIVCVDKFDHRDYPVYVGPGGDFWKEHDSRAYAEWTGVMEVYDLTADRDRQLAERRAFHPPA